MEKEIVYSKVGELISNISYCRANDLYDNWDELINCNENDWGYGGMIITDIIRKNECYNADNTPSLDVISTIVRYEYSMFKADFIPDFLENATEEECECYEEMTDTEVDFFIEKGIEHFKLKKSE